MEPITKQEFIEAIAFGADGLVTVVAQDSQDKRVLMVAWANEEAMRATISTGNMHYYSRKRRKLWRKGETSGNTQRLVSLLVDCDGDTILASVEQTGKACHTGEPTCFFRKMIEGEE